MLKHLQNICFRAVDFSRLCRGRKHVVKMFCFTCNHGLTLGVYPGVGNSDHPVHVVMTSEICDSPAKFVTAPPLTAGVWSREHERGLDTENCALDLAFLVLSHTLMILETCSCSWRGTSRFSFQLEVPSRQINSLNDHALLETYWLTAKDAWILLKNIDFVGLGLNHDLEFLIVSA